MQLNEYNIKTQEVFTRCTSRLNGIGAEQYSTDTEQMFERKTIQQIAQDAFEEIEDCINYLTQLHIKIQQMVERLEK